MFLLHHLLEKIQSKKQFDVFFTLKRILHQPRKTNITVHRQAILLLFVESATRKLRKVVDSRTKFPFDAKRVLDSTTVLVLNSTPILLV